MGKSKSVQQLLNESTADKKRLDEIEVDLLVDQANVNKMLDTSIKEFYLKNKWTYTEYLYGSQTDFQTTSTWSLDSLGGIIDKIAEAVIGTVAGAIVTPEGTKVDENATKINKDAGLTKDTRLLIASNCFNLLSGIVRSFGSVTKIQVSNGEQHIPIGQGLHIFAMVTNKVTQEKSFFKGQTMVSYVYSYKVMYSLDEFAQQAEQTLVAQLDMDLGALHLASQENLEQYKRKEIEIGQYMATSNILKDYTREVQAQIAELKKGKELTLFLEEQITITNKYLSDSDAITKGFGELLSRDETGLNMLKELLTQTVEA